MAQLRQDYEQFTHRQAEVIAIAPDSEKSLAEYWHSQQIPFIGIADPKHVIADLYGQRVNPLKLGRMPALVVIDREGRVRYRHYGESMSDIPSNESVLSTLDSLNRELT